MTNAIKESLEMKLQHLKTFLKQDANERDQRGGTAYEQIGYLKQSGLLPIVVPKHLGGEGATWETILQIVQSIAEVDSAIAHLYAFNMLDIITPHYRGTKEQQEYFYKETLKHNWFWGNAVNTKEKLLFGNLQGTYYILNGTKSFSSGSPGSDYLIIAWRDAKTDEVLSGAIPSNREGLTIHEDWDGFGQKQTGSGTVTFDNVVVYEHEILQHESFGHESYSITRILTLSILGNIFVGVSKGVMQEAKQFLSAKIAEKMPNEIDVIIARKIGDLSIQLRGVEVLAEKINQQVAIAWSTEFHISQQQFDELFIDAAGFNVLAGDVALKITSEIFEVLGARSVTLKNGFDRFWRNVRTHTLHDSVENKKIAAGQFLLTGSLPPFTK